MRLQQIIRTGLKEIDRENIKYVSKKVQICLQAVFWRHILTFSTHRLFLETFSDFLGIIRRFARRNPNCQPRPDKQ